MTRQEAIEAASPSGQGRPNLYKANFIDRLMLRRISRVALALPESFEQRDSYRRVTASGETGANHAVIEVREDFPEEEFSSSTMINLKRSETQPHTLERLEAHKRTMHDDGTWQGELFILGGEYNNMSLFKVMRTVDLASRVVGDAAMLSYIAEHPEANLAHFS